MEGLANVGPIPHDIFQEMMSKPSSLNDVFFDRSGQENRQYSRQSHTYPRYDDSMTFHEDVAQGGFNLQDTTLAQQSAGFDMAPRGSVTCAMPDTSTNSIGDGG